MLKVFESVARLRALNAAAVELNVTVGAVSHTLRGLQDHLGIALFEKEGRRLILTQKGETLSRWIAQAMDDIGQGLRSVAAEPGEGADTTLRLYLPPIFSANWLCSRLFSFVSQQSAVKLEIDVGLNFHSIDWRKIDIAVVYGNPPFDGLWSQAIRTLHLMPVCSPSLLDGVRAIRRPSDLLAHRLLHEDDGSEWRRWLDLARLPVPSQSDVRFRDVGLVLQAAREGHGVALMDEITTHSDLVKGTLVRPLHQTIPSTKNYHCVCPSSKMSQPAVHEFVDWLIKECAGIIVPSGDLVHP
jgi:LysR family glycine cleavage system transcriptional activator